MKPIVELPTADLSAVTGGLGFWGKTLFATTVLLTGQGPMLTFQPALGAGHAPSAYVGR